MKLLLILIGLFNGFISIKTTNVIHTLTFPKNYYLWRNFWKVLVSGILCITAAWALFLWPLYVFNKNNFPEIVIGGISINGYAISIMIGALLWHLLVDKKVLYE